MQAHVHKEDDSGYRSGRGYSLSEVEKSGLRVSQVRNLGIFIDSRRRTLHEFNVQQLKALVEERQNQLREEAEKAREEELERREEKVSRKKARKEEEKKKAKKEEKKKIEKVEVKKEKPGKPSPDLTEIKGVGKKRAEAFNKAGIFTVDDLIAADTGNLARETQFTEDYIETLKERAKTL
ncbi:MAG: ribosomal protein L13e [Theionarchaea archaeon]|nr:ribosomal protein L13e [Theionarchaea archaeon]MBU7000377.1 ribosomal protein L13e [Theionarchaea archaeon]MBU7021219.1 ribosomal protein L13e [Theionarchaea archaeon]MBU7035716.1 ribosomal protein L13e [Theionarchaea archaeon]MBU7039711.1 ribosomal protein L13e [Theionarchaea archaeon]